MFASGSKTKDVIVPSSTTHRPLASILTKTTATTLTQRRISSTGGETIISGATLTGHQRLPQMRSKFTERKPTPVSRTSVAVRTRSQMQSGNSSNNTHLTPRGDGRKVMSGIPTNTAARATARQLQRQEAGTAATAAKQNEVHTKKEENLEQLNHAEIGIQTNEPEILNHDLIIGDIKLLPPKASIIAEIERQQNETRKKLLLKAQRKFEGHSVKQEEHLTDLKEFLEKSAITRRSRKSKVTIEVDKKLIKSMDEILNKSVPKTESITDIKGRIKKKEQELLTLFDTVENLKV
ncbi:uncharacterized protein LOC118744944 [Rhagoletis pomonella]|uniref:uncharacterized protein LOC118744944 n=1 Tax=Rhagoletis pomonella TaxID=28610 RepID=UPI001785F4FC|nr:uncharacterized protein LOC118744944 [Rhagoletis pomonella]